MVTECVVCQAVVHGEAVAHYIRHGTEGDLDTTYHLLKCPRCASPLLLEVVEIGYEEYSEPRRIYPSIEMRTTSLLPKAIRSAYEEALSCFRAKSYTATAVMCRKALEGICAEHGTESRNLVGSLQELKDRGVIDQRLYEWADALRLVGNEAAHDVYVTVGPEDARDIVEFTNALLEYLFAFRERFEKFKKRRSGGCGE